MFKEILLPKKPKLVPFIMAGYPTLEATELFVEDFVEQGIDVIELGIPFSDPLADGPIIQRAAEGALASGTTLTKILELSARLTKKYPQLKLIVFSYLNPLLAFGLENYVTAAKTAGVAATLTVDLPVEEASEYKSLHQKHDLKMVFLASPTTSKERLRSINDSSTGFVYYVSRAGVTGEQTSLSETLNTEVHGLRANVTRPLAIGFGISQPEHVRVVGEIAEAVVIGSALIRIIAEADSVESARTRLREFLKACVEALPNESTHHGTC